MKPSTFMFSGNRPFPNFLPIVFLHRFGAKFIIKTIRIISQNNSDENLYDRNQWKKRKSIFLQTLQPRTERNTVEPIPQQQ